MTILDEIVVNKRIEIEDSKKMVSLGQLMESEFFLRKKNSLAESIRKTNGNGIIAEFKRKSPSKGMFGEHFDVEKTTTGYTKGGAAGISVLTDFNYFGGTKEDLISARKYNPSTPLLRKDFMIDEYQLYEAKAWGADVILLIAAQLKAEEILNLSKKAHELDLEVLLEVHDEEEIAKSPFDYIDIVGVNNRNLKNFAENNVNASLRLIELLPKDIIKISESCISQPETVKQLKKVGYEGFLMGENFMKTEDPSKALADFVKQINED